MSTKIQVVDPMATRLPPPKQNVSHSSLISQFSLRNPFTLLIKKSKGYHPQVLRGEAACRAGTRTNNGGGSTKLNSAHIISITFRSSIVLSIWFD